MPVSLYIPRRPKGKDKSSKQASSRMENPSGSSPPVTSLFSQMSFRKNEVRLEAPEDADPPGLHLPQAVIDTSSCVCDETILQSSPTSLAPEPVATEDVVDMQPKVRNISKGPSVMEGAHDFIVKNSTVYTIGGDQIINNSGDRMPLEVLARVRVPGTGLNSVSRDPPPKCHPDTRKELREELTEWLLNTEGGRRHLMVWLRGPAGAGKSAVAQTFGEDCKKIGRLGGTFFFARHGGKRSEPDAVITTIAYQLAFQHKGYRNEVLRILQESSESVLDATLRIQFRKLIVEPFNALMASQDHDSVQNPFVIIIDGLDECASEKAQAELIQLIGDYASLMKTRHSPLLWLLGSRPEAHIKKAFADAASGSPIDCLQKEITCDGEKDAHDVEIILRDELSKLRPNTSWDSSASRTRPWPSKPDLKRLASLIGGLPVLASTIIRFISDSKSTPEIQLNTCLLFLDRQATSDNPLEKLDILYLYIMEQVSTNFLPVAKLIISFYIILTTQVMQEKISSARDIATFLGLTPGVFYCALLNLHSVIDVPAQKEADKKGLKIFHKSFSDFLQDPKRSGRFALDVNHARLEVARLAIQHYNIMNRANCKLPDGQCSLRRSIASSLEEDTDLTVQVSKFIRANFWDMLCVDDSSKGRIAEELQLFDFCHLPYYPGNLKPREDRGLPRFMKWISRSLSSVGQDDARTNSPIRLEPLTELDTFLLRICSKEPPLQDRLPDDVNEQYKYTYSFISSHRPLDRIVNETSTMALWIGEGERAVLGILDGRKMPPKKKYKVAGAGGLE
ncbi:hypothetical protein NP233_g895 [Leucocoprinus birnbaumii]|uniref:Nephrocystin 3-like N-terminal domain-containing protein n=1 Tax=Leucocoprinus birnbaumii TaxID=56174 RepID=A0AAD5Z007_9AGAR|nr:hypothetical protein NP233_g895 [Leucocoprinus birnbaumii]